MAKLKILTYPDKMLKKKCFPVKEITPEIKALINDMFETMYENSGVGLAANQVGKNVRICVIDVRTDGKKTPIALINPAIIKRSGQAVSEEGCLSLPGLVEKITRSSKVRVTATSASGLPLEFDAEGLLCRAIQHEIDHLDGKVFVERLPLIKRLKSFRNYKKLRNAKTL